MIVVGAFVVTCALASESDPADGARLYARHCACCHGVGARGGGPQAVLFDPPPRDLGSGFLDRYATDDLVRRIRAGTPLALDLDALRVRAVEVEAILAHLERLPAVDWPLVDGGQELYIDQCEICHGPYGRSGAELPEGVVRPRDLSDPAWQRATSDRELVVAVRHGRGGMPAILPRIGDADVPALAAFVRLLSPGYEQYSLYCSTCHGDDGRGDGGFTEALPRPTFAFDRRYFAMTDPEEVRRGLWHMLAEKRPAMPHLGSALTVREARAIVDYLKERAPAP